MGEAGGPVHLMGEKIDSRQGGRGYQSSEALERGFILVSDRDMLLGSVGCPSRVGVF